MLAADVGVDVLPQTFLDVGLGGPLGVSISVGVAVLHHGSILLLIINWRRRRRWRRVVKQGQVIWRWRGRWSRSICNCRADTESSIFFEGVKRSRTWRGRLMKHAGLMIEGVWMVFEYYIRQAGCITVKNIPWMTLGWRQWFWRKTVDISTPKEIPHFFCIYYIWHERYWLPDIKKIYNHFEEQ